MNGGRTMMHSDRRLLLKSLTAAGMAISGAGWLPLAGAAPMPTGAAREGADDVLAGLGSQLEKARNKAHPA